MFQVILVFTNQQIKISLTTIKIIKNTIYCSLNILKISANSVFNLNFKMKCYKSFNIQIPLD